MGRRWKSMRALPPTLAKRGFISPGVRRGVCCLDKLPQLPDLQAAWLLLLFCTSPRAQHLLRTPANRVAGCSPPCLGGGLGTRGAGRWAVGADSPGCGGALCPRAFAQEAQRLCKERFFYSRPFFAAITRVTQITPGLRSWPGHQE